MTRLVGTAPLSPRRWERLAAWTATLPIPRFASMPEAILLAVALAVAAVMTFGAIVRWDLNDVDAYWNAALRLRAGQTLYEARENVEAYDVYRYAPWFAYLWVPLTLVPRWLAEAAWSVALVAATIGSVSHLVTSRRAPAVAVGAVLGSLMLLAACYGNVQPLVIAALVRTVDRRTGPVWVGVAASLKFVPLLYVLVYIGRREWSRAALAVGVAAVLLGPMLLYDLSGYTTDPGEPLISLYNVSPFLWGAAAAAALAVAVVASLRRSRFAWIALNTAVLLALPRAHLNYVSYYLVGTRPTPRRRDSADGGA